MRPLWMFGLAGAVVMAAVAGGSARAADEKKDEGRKADRRFEVRRMIGGGGRLGVSLEDVAGGAVVTDVREGSAAEKAGLREGDVIARFAGEIVRTAAQLVRLVRETPAGRGVELEVSRGGAIQKMQVTLERPGRDHVFSFGPWRGGENLHFEMPEMPEMPDLPDLADMPSPPEPPMPPAPPRFFFGQGRKLGLSFQELGDQLARYFKVEGGVLVTEVEEDGPAAQAGIQAGDVIVRVGGTEVEDGGDLREAIRGAEAGSRTTVVVQRDGRSIDLSVTVGDAGRARLAPGSTRPRRRGGRS